MQDESAASKTARSDSCEVVAVESASVELTVAKFQSASWRHGALAFFELYRLRPPETAGVVVIQHF